MAYERNRSHVHENNIRSLRVVWLGQRGREAPAIRSTKVVALRNPSVQHYFGHGKGEGGGQRSRMTRWSAGPVLRALPRRRKVLSQRVWGGGGGDRPEKHSSCLCSTVKGQQLSCSHGGRRCVGLPGHRVKLAVTFWTGSFGHDGAARRSFESPSAQFNPKIAVLNISVSGSACGCRGVDRRTKSCYGAYCSRTRQYVSVIAHGSSSLARCFFRYRQCVCGT